MGTHEQKISFYLKRANTNFNNKNYHEAISLYSEAIALLEEAAGFYAAENHVHYTTNLPEAYKCRAVCYRGIGEYEKAVSDCTKSIEIDPDNELVWAVRGDSYREMKEYDKAIADLTVALELNPQYAFALLAQRGITYIFQGNYPAAIKDLEQAMQLAPNENCWNEIQRAYLAIPLEERSRFTASSNLNVPASQPPYTTVSSQPISSAQPPVSVSVRLPFEPEMILIPAGEFLMGSDPKKNKAAQNEEQPQHTLYLPDYYIAKTPITNAQYAAFVKATGHRVPNWRGVTIPKSKKAHPVVYVTWYDALAYCKWLAEATGKPYTLPSEAEWEKAARGTDGRIYPWGDAFDRSKCNTKESGIKDTTPIDKYPQGASPYGVLDVAGNVWEWTRSLWGPWDGEDFKLQFIYPYCANDGRENLQAGDAIPRVMRGGSFGDSRDDARCASRSMSLPDDGFAIDGFRVAVSPSRA